jgi:translation initiation factor 2 subunit 2
MHAWRYRLTILKLLARVFRIIRQNNPEFAGDKRRYTMIPPQVGREGKKSIFANIGEICRRCGHILLNMRLIV